jgi:aminobenzoyl-glutamate utilization protein B
VGEENFDKLVNIGKGAALMTGTTMEMEPFAAAWPTLGNKDDRRSHSEKYRKRSECRNGPMTR